MKTIPLMFLLLMLSGCGTYGEPLLLARMFDANDPCQGAVKPSFCGAASGPTVYQRNYRTGAIINTYRFK